MTATTTTLTPSAHLHLICICIVLEAGWGTPSSITGVIRLVSSKPLKEAKLILEFQGQSETHWSGAKVRKPGDPPGETFVRSFPTGHCGCSRLEGFAGAQRVWVRLHCRFRSICLRMACRPLLEIRVDPSNTSSCVVVGMGYGIAMCGSLIAMYRPISI
ncbi:hypothetical protein BASA83_011298 [Batrachochytrium salamandrivorans]|nr:hypothetical protein BASA83_011298 [Batrachochytrium salamandrivorans]